VILIAPFKILFNKKLVYEFIKFALVSYGVPFENSTNCLK